MPRILPDAAPEDPPYTGTLVLVAVKAKLQGRVFLAVLDHDSEASQPVALRPRSGTQLEPIKVVLESVQVGTGDLGCAVDIDGGPDWQRRDRWSGVGRSLRPR